jgi:hypothetical protein
MPGGEQIEVDTFGRRQAQDPGEMVEQAVDVGVRRVPFSKPLYQRPETTKAAARSL